MRACPGWGVFLERCRGEVEIDGTLCPRCRMLREHAIGKRGRQAGP